MELIEQERKVLPQAHILEKRIKGESKTHKRNPPNSN